MSTSSTERLCLPQRLTSSMPTHPLPILMNHGVHVALCSDDPAVFGNMGLTFDYFQVWLSLKWIAFGVCDLHAPIAKVLVASEVTGLITLGEMAQDSIRVSKLNLHLPWQTIWPSMNRDSILLLMRKRRNAPCQPGRRGGINSLRKLSRNIIREIYK